MIFPQANCGGPDQTSLTVASDLGLQYLLTTKLGLWAYIGSYRLIFFFFFFFFFFDLGFTALSRIFHLYRADRSSKVGENRSTRRKTTWPSVSRTWLSHIWPELGSNHSGEKPNGLRVNSLIHQATGARMVQVDISASKLHVDPDQTPLTVVSALGLHYYIQEMNSGLILVRYKLIFLQENCGDPDQTLLTVASALGLHNLPTAKSWTLGLYWLGTSWYFCKHIMEILIRRL